MRKALILMTSHNVLGSTAKPTGFHWVEMATPYFRLKEAGFDVTLSSVIGGRPPSDPSSSLPEDREAAVEHFLTDAAAMDELERTHPLGDLDPADYDIVYIPGGHGTMWDLAQTKSVGAFIAAAWEAGAIVGSVCHGPAALTECYLSDGTPLVSGKRVNAFSDSEEHAVGLHEIVPFLLETRLKEQGALYEGTSEDFGTYVAQDDRLVTGQNPASVPALAEAMIAMADKTKKAA